MAPNRNYSQRTIKVLFAASGNQCAHPDCTNPVVIDGTEFSDATISAQIAHIYAVSDNGPRGKSGLTPKEKNAPENLILLCPTHHGIVDSQHDSYPATLLQAWKVQHEGKYKKQLPDETASLAISLSMAKSLVDEEINKGMMLVRRARFIDEFDQISFSLRLGQRIVSGEYSAGSNQARGKALAWCARLLSTSDHKATASKLLEASERLLDCEEVRIAKAFCLAAGDQYQEALSLLSALHSQAAKTAAFLIVANKKGAEAGIDWLHKAGLTCIDLDPDGKLSYLQRLAQLGRWDLLFTTTNDLGPNDFLSQPALHHFSGMSYLLRTIPTELRGAIFTQLPFSPKAFPLASNVEAIFHRKVAATHFRKMAEAAESYGCLKAAKIALDYVLWLELRDTDTTRSALEVLEASLRDTSNSLRRLPLALEFGIKVDLNSVETEIERQTALNGGTTADTASARLAIALSKTNALEAAKYIEVHREELTKFLDRVAITSLEVEMLAKAGLIDRARITLTSLRNTGLEHEVYQRLERTISESQGEDPIAGRKAQFETTKALGDLCLLVDALEDGDDWVSLEFYADLLFQKTGSVRDAERLAVSLYNLKKDRELYAFFATNADLLSQSRRLSHLKCLVLFNKGDLNTAAEAVAKLCAIQDSVDLRLLRTNIAIALGDWDSLNALIAECWFKRDERCANELLNSAHLGFITSSPHSKDLLFEAAKRNPDDPELLTGAYHLATNAGLEDDPKTFTWFAKAIELSGPDGPVQSFSLKDLVERKPEWDRREADTWKMLAEGALPIFGAARLLNRTLIDFFLYPAIANLDEADPRKRGLIPAFSGARLVASLPFAKSYGLDPTALMTFSILGVLANVLDSASQFYIPHSTMAWLLEEKQHAAFHQPSRIRSAQTLRSLIASNRLRVFDGAPSNDEDLLAEVDDDLAALISECVVSREGIDPQRLVIRSYPVHRIGSLMQETANLDIYQKFLCSCTGVLEKLKAKGVLTEQEARKASEYLSSHEKNWPSQPSIDDNAELYLDDLSVAYLHHTGLLRKLKDAGLSAYVSRRVREEADSLIAYQDLASAVTSHLDNIRESLRKAIRDGKVVVGSVCRSGMKDSEPIGSHPSFAIVELASCEIIVADDRFLNQHPAIERDGRRIPVINSMELLDTLCTAGHIDVEKLKETRTRLRQAAYSHVPIDLQELLEYLSSSAVKNGHIQENAELRAVRENALRVRMSNYLRLPHEAPWLHSLTTTLMSAVRAQWSPEVEDDVARARSNWLHSLLDVRGWSSGYGQKAENRMFDRGYATYIFLLTTPSQTFSEETRDRYWAWLEEMYLKPLSVEQPELYEWLLEITRKRIAGIVSNASGPGKKE